MSIESASPAASRFQLLRAVFRSAQGRLGMGLTLIVVLAACLGPQLRPWDPQALESVPGAGPAPGHLLGSDALGRDVLSRLLSGGASILIISLLAVVGAYAAGLLVGMMSAYLGGRVDATVIRVLDLLYSLPTLLMFIVAVSVFGQSATVLTVLLAFGFFPAAARIVRGVARSVTPKEYVLAAELRGESIIWIMIREVLPNAAGPLIADAAFMFTSAVLAIATLNYLGLGSQPPATDWGTMIAENQNIIGSNPAAVLAPAVMLAVLTLGVNLVADVIARYASRESGGPVVEL